MTLARVMLWLAGACAACVWLAGRAAGTVTCRTACAKCSARTEHKSLLEVYCAMCHECRERRRAWRHFAPRRRNKTALATNTRPSPAQRANDHDDFPDESPDGLAEGRLDDEHPEQPRCPEPPPCDYEAPEGGGNVFMATTPERARPPRVPQSGQAPTPLCQEHAGCPAAAGVPCCLPVCPYAPPCVQNLASQKMTLPQTTPAPTEYFYIHVGVPKDILNSM